MYFTRTDGTSINYTNGPLADAENAVMKIPGSYGHGGAYPFNVTFTPRIWNGTVYYEPCGEIDLDCNDNCIPDDCDVAAVDCNGNDIPDDCDIAECPDCEGCEDERLPTGRRGSRTWRQRQLLRRPLLRGPGLR
jgi:hypothetical protein